MRSYFNVRRANLIDALDTVTMHASDREIAKVQLRRAEAIVNRVEQAVVMSRQFAANVKLGFSFYARRLWGRSNHSRSADSGFVPPESSQVPRDVRSTA